MINLVTVDDLATEFQKHHHDSDLLRMLVADLRERRVDLNVFCRRARMLIGAPALLATLKSLKVLQSLKKAQLQEREDQLASPVRAGNCRPPRAPAGELWSFQSTVAGPTPPFTASTTAAAASPAAASPAAASSATTSPAAASPSSASSAAASPPPAAASPPATGASSSSSSSRHSSSRKARSAREASRSARDRTYVHGTRPVHAHARHMHGACTAHARLY